MNLGGLLFGMCFPLFLCCLFFRLDRGQFQPHLRHLVHQTRPLRGQALHGGCKFSSHCLPDILAFHLKLGYCLQENILTPVAKDLFVCLTDLIGLFQRHFVLLHYSVEQNQFFFLFSCLVSGFDKLALQAIDLAPVFFQLCLIFTTESPAKKNLWNRKLRQPFCFLPDSLLVLLLNVSAARNDLSL